MAISGDSTPQFTTIAKFVRELGPGISSLFTQVPMTCDTQGLTGRHMFAIDGVKVPSNAAKHRSGIHTELEHDARRMERAVHTMLKAHQIRDTHNPQDDGDEDEAPNRYHLEKLQNVSERIRNFLSSYIERKGAKGSIRKSNVTGNDSAKMATAKDVI